MEDRSYTIRVLLSLLLISTIAGKPVKLSLQAKIQVTAHMKNLNNALKNPPTTKRTRLFCQGSGGYVRIKNTAIDAITTDKTDPHTLLKMDQYGKGIITIRSNRSGAYVCFDTSGNVEIRQTFHNRCVFQEQAYKNSFVIYQTRYNNKSWFLGFKGKNGRGQPKKGERTQIGQRAVTFTES